MTPYNSSQIYESYTPVYDVIPPEWEKARGAITEYLKKISEGIDEKERGWFLEQQLLTGGNFVPSPSATDSAQYRSVFRMVVNCSPLVIGTNTFAHNIDVTADFTLVHAYAAATNSTGLVSEPIPNGNDTLNLTSTDVVIVSAAAYDKCYCVIEYLLEP